MINPFSLEGKTILVTGASSGIGRGIAIECSKMGAHIILTARNEERLKETLSLMDGVGHQIVVADLLDNTAVANLVNSIDKLDGVVLNAGINDKKLVKFIDEDFVNQMMSLNFTSTALLIQKLLKKKKINKEASIVIMSSVSAFYPSISNAMYGATKAALNQFAKVLALEVKSQNIRVNCIQPAFVETEMLQKYTLQDEISQIRASYMQGRFATPAEIGQITAFYLSDTTKLITGTSVVVDGGFTL